MSIAVEQMVRDLKARVDALEAEVKQLLAEQARLLAQLPKGAEVKRVNGSRG